MLFSNNKCTKIVDTGEPLVVNMEQVSFCNQNFRTALWTGKHLQTTLMNIRVGEDIGLEIHGDTDQYIMVVDGFASVCIGESKENLNYRKGVQEGYGIFIPAGYYHNIINTGNKDLKLISVYAPPHHPQGTVHATKEIAQREEEY